MGVLFNDSTRLILYDDGDSLQYIERDGTESYLSVSSHPTSLTKKVSGVLWPAGGQGRATAQRQALMAEALPALPPDHPP